MPFKDKKSPAAIEAQRKAWKKYYDAHPEYHVARRKASQKSNADYIDSFKLECRDCGNSDKRVLDFHHIDDTTKTFTLSSRRVAGYAKNKIKTEIDKCEVLCANCHRINHWKERNEIERWGSGCPDSERGSEINSVS